MAAHNHMARAAHAAREGGEAHGELRLTRRRKGQGSGWGAACARPKVKEGKGGGPRTGRGFGAALTGFSAAYACTLFGVESTAAGSTSGGGLGLSLGLSLDALRLRDAR